MEEVVRSSSSKNPRTIREVSHLFLSSVSHETEKVTRMPLMSCYVTRNVKDVNRAIRETVLLLRDGEKLVYVGCLDENPFHLKSAAEFEVLQVSSSRLLDFHAAKEAVSLSSKVLPEYFFLTFSENDCALLDPLFSMISIYLVILPSTGRDITEAYKFMKAISSLGSRTNWFFRFHPEESVTVSQRIGEAYQKFSEKFLRVPIQILHSGIPGALRHWQHVLTEPNPDLVREQSRLLSRIFEDA
ncbi:MAG: hypothetical protein HY587_07725 [Candidatus Omnitrophica bacterium]|nr:hypothetical protein [Candidatus Omnitrophota bacterium]